MVVDTKKQNLKTMLQMYMVQEMKKYDVFENLPPHDFSEEYRGKMSRMMEQPMKKRSFISNFFKK